MEQQLQEQLPNSVDLNSLRIAEAEERHKRRYSKERLNRSKRLKELDNDAIVGSFRSVEDTTLMLLNNKPLIALSIFALTGCVAAYVSGFFILEGYISSPNPYANGEIPYWDFDDGTGELQAAQQAQAVAQQAAAAAAKANSWFRPK